MLFQNKQNTIGDALLAAGLDALPVAGRSPWRDARERFFRNKAAVASLVLLLLI
ncbi:MAG: peptide ABC transporter permease, partial [Craterilacuibacter sp.]